MILLMGVPIWLWIMLVVVTILNSCGYLWYQKQEAAEISYVYFNAKIKIQRYVDRWDHFDLESDRCNLRQINGLHIWEVRRKKPGKGWLNRFDDEHYEWEMIDDQRIQQYIEQAIYEKREIEIYLPCITIEPKQINYKLNPQ